MPSTIIVACNVWHMLWRVTTFSLPVSINITLMILIHPIPQLFLFHWLFHWRSQFWILQARTYSYQTTIKLASRFFFKLFYSSLARPSQKWCHLFFSLSTVADHTRGWIGVMLNMDQGCDLDVWHDRIIGMVITQDLGAVQTLLWRDWAPGSLSAFCLTCQR